ncbi:hypothetical protein SASPL_144253 [Salvia splendens]|uniref:Tf2-1-like SH3-like domain-containing protein n=1 Tax=Salvia splendens TaxID=180675 RepID=A0A8X8WMT3_SALSN|nr:hypothetical protein SASPL_144253 [Salvia splendens]
MAPRFFGPFRIEARIGATAYRLQLPASTRIHPVFHVSLLKRAIGEATSEATLPDELGVAALSFLPEKVLATRIDQREGGAVDQVLIKWLGMDEDEATFTHSYIAAVHKDGSWSVLQPKLQDQVEITVAAHDTTGGMITKITEAAMIAKLGIDVYIVKAATEHSARALKGPLPHNIPDDWLGTVIRLAH